MPFVCVCEKQKFWRDHAYVQARLSLCCLPMRYRVLADMSVFQ